MLRVAITGAAGQLGRELVRAFTDAGDEVLALSRPQFDLRAPASLMALGAWRPNVVINSAAYTDVDGCARDPALAMLINGDAARAVAQAAASVDALVVQISTNEVFDGELARPYTEDDEPNPINPYGESKLAGERGVAEANPRHLIVRTAWLFGPEGTNFVTKIQAAAQRAADLSTPLRVVSDEWGNPTWVPDLALALSQAVRLGIRGILHLAGQPPASRYEWASLVVEGSGVALEAIPAATFSRASTAPRRAVLSTSVADRLGIRRIEWRGPARALQIG